MVTGESKRTVSPVSKYSLTWHFLRDYPGSTLPRNFPFQVVLSWRSFAWKSQVTPWSCQTFGCRLCTCLGGKQLELVSLPHTSDFPQKVAFWKGNPSIFWEKSRVGEMLYLIWPEAVGWRKWQGAIRVIKWQGCVGKVYLHGIDWVVSFPNSSCKCRLMKCKILGGHWNLRWRGDFFAVGPFGKIMWKMDLFCNRAGSGVLAHLAKFKESFTSNHGNLSLPPKGWLRDHGG